MIASVTGSVAAVQPSSLVVEVGGVGLTVLCTPQQAAATRHGDVVSLRTSLVVREESLTLYGFADAEQREIFEAVQTVSGVGPRTAMALLATMSPEDLRRAIAAEDVAALTRVPGIGSKGAQRLIIELKDRLRSVPGAVGAAPQDWQATVAEALASLGWSTRDADAAVAAVAATAGEDPDISQLLRAALQHLDRR